MIPRCSGPESYLCWALAPITWLFCSAVRPRLGLVRLLDSESDQDGQPPLVEQARQIQNDDCSLIWYIDLAYGPLTISAQGSASEPCEVMSARRIRHDEHIATPPPSGCDITRYVITRVARRQRLSPTSHTSIGEMPPRQTLLHSTHQHRCSASTTHGTIVSTGHPGPQVARMARDSEEKQAEHGGTPALAFLWCAKFLRAALSPICRHAALDRCRGLMEPSQRGKACCLCSQTSKWNWWSHSSLLVIRQQFAANI